MILVLVATRVDRHLIAVLVTWLTRVVKVRWLVVTTVRVGVRLCALWFVITQAVIA